MRRILFLLAALAFAGCTCKEAAVSIGAATALATADAARGLVVGGIAYRFCFAGRHFPDSRAGDLNEVLRFFAPVVQWGNGTRTAQGN